MQSSVLTLLYAALMRVSMCSLGGELFGGCSESASFFARDNIGFGVGIWRAARAWASGRRFGGMRARVAIAGVGRSVLRVRRLGFGKARRLVSIFGGRVHVGRNVGI
jgi:hypothetical protein